MYFFISYMLDIWVNLCSPAIFVLYNLYKQEIFLSRVNNCFAHGRTELLLRIFTIMYFVQNCYCSALFSEVTSLEWILATVDINLLCIILKCTTV